MILGHNTEIMYVRFFIDERFHAAQRAHRLGQGYHNRIAGARCLNVSSRRRPSSPDQVFRPREGGQVGVGCYSNQGVLISLSSGVQCALMTSSHQRHIFGPLLNKETKKLPGQEKIWKIVDEWFNKKAAALGTRSFTSPVWKP